MTSIPRSASRDYSLTGESARRAVEAGLVAAEWYHTDVLRKDMKALMARSDGPAIRDTALWILLHMVTAAGGIWFWGTWASVPFWIAYRVLYGSACDSRWHECGLIRERMARSGWMASRSTTARPDKPSPGVEKLALLTLGVTRPAPSWQSA